MYKITIMLQEDRRTGRVTSKEVLEGDDRKELQEQIPDVIAEMTKREDFKSPVAEYVIERDGMYIDGECDVKVKITKNGVAVKMGELMI